MMYEPASAAASTSAPPPSAPTPNDVDLLERLRLSEEWNLRLQAQLQEILRLPMNEVDVMRERMQNPDLAIPLLQCYDAAILEKSEQIAALKKELMHIHTQAEAATCDRGDLTQALRVAEEMTKQTQAQASAEVLKMDAAQRELRLEVSQLQQELARCMAMESEARMRAEKLEKTATEQQTTLETLRVEHTRVREELQLTQNRLRMREQVEGEGQLQTETQRVKLHLLTSENQERLQELERLRNQMTLALRQAADNHNAHLRVVEERHRMVLEEVRAANQTQELELLKLRAQLARIDPAGPLSNRGGGGGTLHPTNSSSLLHTTTELLDAQSRQAKDMELKRMYSEVASAQMQRDEAVQRWEQLTRNAKREMDHAMMDARREADQLRAKVEQERTRSEDAETEKDRLQQRVSEVEQHLRQAQSEVQQSKTECGTLRRQLAEMQREHGIHKMELDQSRAELRDTIAADQKRVGALEQRVAEVVSELQSTTDRSATQVAAAERQRNAATENLRESELRVQKLKATIAEQVRQLEAGHLQQQHISEALETHKRDLQRSDQRVQQLHVQVEALRGERREYLLSLEQLKLENGRLVRACRESCRGSVADYATSRVVA